MKRQATSRNDESRYRAEWTGFFATTTATAVASARTAKTTNAQPAPAVRSTPEAAASVISPSPLLDHGEGLHVGRRVPVRELADVQVERLVAVVGRHLVGLRRQPDGLGLRRARLLAELAEHAALQVHVEAVGDLHGLARLVLLVVPVDVDDVDRALDRAERALDAPLLVQPEHPAEAVRRDLLLLGVLDGDLLLEEVAARDRQPLEEVEERELVEPFPQRHGVRLLTAPPPGPRARPPGGRAASGPDAASPAGTSARRRPRRSRPG